MKRPSAEALRPHQGRWVLIENGKVVVVGDDEEQLLNYIRYHKLEASTLLVKV